MLGVCTGNGARDTGAGSVYRFCVCVCCAVSATIVIRQRCVRIASFCDQTNSIVMFYGFWMKSLYFQRYHYVRSRCVCGTHGLALARAFGLALVLARPIQIDSNNNDIFHFFLCVFGFAIFCMRTFLTNWPTNAAGHTWTTNEQNQIESNRVHAWRCLNVRRRKWNLRECFCFH